MATAAMQDIARIEGSEAAVARLEARMGIREEEAPTSKMSTGRMDEVEAPVKAKPVFTLAKKNGSYYVKDGGQFGFQMGDKKWMAKSTSKPISSWLEAGWTVHIVRDGKVVATRTP